MADRDFGYHIVKHPGTVTVSSSGLPLGPMLTGAGLLSLDDGLGSFLIHPTETGTNSVAGLMTTFDVLAAGWRPEIEFEVKLPIVTSDLRLWIGLFSEQPDLLIPLSGRDFAAFYFGPDGPNSSFWRGVTSNASDFDDLPTVPAVAGTLYRLRIKALGGSPTNPPTAVEFYVNDPPLGAQATSAKIPGSSTLLAIGVRATNLSTTGVAKQVLWNRVSWRYDLRVS